MKKAILLAAMLTVPASAAAPTGFNIWKTGDLLSKDLALSINVGADHSARETLADYGDHRFRMLYRNADGAPEEHDSIIDIVMVQSGGGELQLGGTMEGKRSTTPGEFVGTKLEGGERYPIGPGDIVHIPAGVPHAFLVTGNRHITYVLLKIPAQ